MAKDRGIVVCEHPAWLDVAVPAEYEDAGLYDIILFFVIHAPCPGQSGKAVTLAERGWKAKPWNSPSYLKDKLDRAIFRNQLRRLKMVDSKREMLQECDSLDLGNDFYTRHDTQRAMFVKVNKPGCVSEYMSLFYHIRNALAHGRLAMYPSEDGDITFVMEDGKTIGAEIDDQFEVSARIVLRKSSLLEIIRLLKNPPLEADYTEEIVQAIKQGVCVKKQIIALLEISENTYEEQMQKLKLNHLITYEHNRWVLQNP